MRLRVQVPGGKVTQLSAAGDNIVACMALVSLLATPFAVPFAQFLVEEMERRDSLDDLLNPIVHIGVGAVGVGGLIFGIPILLIWVYFGERRRLRRLSTEKMPEVMQDEVVRGMSETNLKSLSLEWRWRSMDFGMGACVVNSWRPSIVLARGLCEMRRFAPERLRAIVSHELAHLRNRDTLLVPLIYLLRFLGKLSGAVVLLYWIGVVAGLGRSTQMEGGVLLSFISIIINFIYMIWLGEFLLNRREYYADIGAVNVLPSKIAYLKILLCSKNSSAPHHPTPFDRVEALIYGSPVAARSKRMIALALWLPLQAVFTMQWLFAVVLMLGALYVVAVEWRKGAVPGVPTVFGYRQVEEA